MSRSGGGGGTAPPHSLTFRVMRLTAATPSLRPALPFVCADAADAAAAAGPTDKASYPDALLRATPPYEGEGAPASVGTVSVLPASFGSIYASETFRSFISTYNLTDTTVYSVSVTIEIQTASQRRISLVSTRTPVNVPAHDALPYVVAAPLPELGVHVLSCTASYVDRTGMSRVLRQLFRFNVLPPLEPFVNVIPLHRRRLTNTHAVATVGDNAPALAGVAGQPSEMAQFLVDLRIVNTMPVPVYITSAQLHADPMYTIVKPLIRPDDPAAEPASGYGSEEEPFDDPDDDRTVQEELPPRAASLGVGDTRNFLFFVARPVQPGELANSIRGRSGAINADFSSPWQSDPLGAAESAQASDTAPRSAPDVGRREIGSFSLRWHSGSGERGQMDKVIVAFEPAMKSAEIEVHIAAVPHDIQVQTPFAARCVARNNTSNPVRLYLQIRRDLVGEIVPVGMSGVSLGEVAPESSSECLLSLIALSRGQHSISGIRVVDIESRHSYSAEAPLVSVL